MAPSWNSYRPEPSRSIPSGPRNSISSTSREARATEGQRRGRSPSPRRDPPTRRLSPRPLIRNLDRERDREWERGRDRAYSDRRTSRDDYDSPHGSFRSPLPEKRDLRDEETMMRSNRSDPQPLRKVSDVRGDSASLSTTTGNTERISGLLSQFAEHIAKQAHLLQEQERCLKVEKRLQQDYDKSRSLHKSYPSSEESQRIAVRKTKDDLSEINKNVDSTKGLMGDIIRSLVLYLTPTEQRSDNLFDLRAFGSLKDKYEEKFEAQQKYISELEDRLQKSEQCNESRWLDFKRDTETSLKPLVPLQEAITALKNSGSSLEQKLEDQQNFITNLESRIADTERVNASKWDALKSDAESVLKNISALQKLVPADLKAKLENISTEIARFPSHRLELSRVNAELRELKESYSTDQEKIEQAVSGTLEACESVRSDFARFDRESQNIFGLPRFLQSSESPKEEDIVKTLASLGDRCTAFENTLNGLLTRHERDIDGIRTTVVNGRQDTHPPGLERRLTEIQNSLEGAMLSIRHLDVRWQNISTDHLARQMLGQLESSYPKLRQAEDSLQRLSTALDCLTGEIDIIKKDADDSKTVFATKIGKLYSEVDALSEKLQDQEPIRTPQVTTSIFNRKRKADDSSDNAQNSPRNGNQTGKKRKEIGGFIDDSE